MLDESHQGQARPGADAGRCNVITFPGYSRGSVADRARTRRDWLMARWAAERIGLDAGSARSYARRLAAGTSAQDSLLHRISSDFEAAGLPVDTGALYRKMDDFHIQAVIWARCTPAAG